MSDKKSGNNLNDSDNNNCSCGKCNFCCNGYVQDANKPNRYVNLETGKVRDLEKKSNSLVFLLLLWFVAALLITRSNDISIRNCQKTGKASSQNISKPYCR